MSKQNKNSLIYSMQSLFSGLFTVFKHIFKRPVTLEYPEKKKNVPETFRGKPFVEGCIGCGICKKVCPSGALYINKTEDSTVSVSIDLKRCIFCGNCAYYCPRGAIKMSKEYELATGDKEELVSVYIQSAERSIQNDK